MPGSRSHFFSALLGGLVVAVLMTVLPAVATNSDPMIIGSKNAAVTVTRLNTRGGLRIDNVKAGNPALVLNVADPASAPFQVNATGLITNLNADLLDGIDSTGFAADGHNHDTDYLGIGDTASDSALLDSLDSTAFSLAGHLHAGYTAAIHEHSWADLTSGVPGDLADGDNDTVGALD